MLKYTFLNLIAKLSNAMMMRMEMSTPSLPFDPPELIKKHSPSFYQQALNYAICQSLKNHNYKGMSLRLNKQLLKINIHIVLFKN